MKVHFELCGSQDMMLEFSFAPPFSYELLRCIINFVLEGELKV